MEKLGETKLYLDTISLASGGFYASALLELLEMPTSAFDMQVVEEIFTKMFHGTYTYELGGRVYTEKEMDEDELLADVKPKVLKKATNLPALIANLAGKPVKIIGAGASNGDENSIYTCLFNIARDVHINDRVVAVNEGMRALIDTAGLNTTEELVKVCSFIVQAAGVLKGKLGTLNSSVFMTSDEAKDRLGRMVIKDKMSVATPLLLSYLIRYQFELKCKGDQVPAPRTPMTLDTFSSGHSVGVNITLDGITLMFNVDKGNVTVVGNIPAFFSMWNAHLKSEEMEYVEIHPALKLQCDTLLALFDLKYVHTAKTWTMARSAQYSRMGNFKNVSNDDWTTLSKYNVRIVEEMNKMAAPLSHYNDQYNLYLVTCKAVMDDDIEFGAAIVRLMSTSGLVALELSKKAATVYNDIMLGKASLKEAVKMCTDARTDRSNYRNVGPREAMTKNLFDPLYPCFPSPLVTARKFLSIMVANPSLYSMDCDVYGSANMHFYEPVARPHQMVVDRQGQVVKPGARTFYDNKANFLGNNVGVEVVHGDLYTIQEGSGINKGLIDDVQVGFSKEVKQSMGEFAVTYPGGCMSHKIRVLHKAKYKAACLKMMMNKMKIVEPDKELNLGWLYPLSFYKTVIFDTPGKLQSGEFFIYVNDRQSEPVPGKLDMLKRQWIVFAQRKCAVMVFAHGLMNAATLIVDKKMDRRNALFDGRVLKKALPSTFRDATDERVIANALSTQVINVGVINKDSDKILYSPFMAVGKAYVQASEDDKVVLGMDILDLQI